MPQKCFVLVEVQHRHQSNEFICEDNWLLVIFRSKELQSEAVDLRERIKHLNDMVFCQQRKVKGMIEEVRRVYLSLCVSCMHLTFLFIFVF